MRLAAEQNLHNLQIVFKRCAPHSRISSAAKIAICSALFSAAFTHGQVAITGWTLNRTDAANDTQDGVTYQSTTVAVTGFSTAGSPYDLGLAASSVFIRRNTDSSGNGTQNQAGIDNNNRSSLWNTQNSGTTNLLGTYQTSLGGALLNNNVIMGADNLFANSSNTATVSAANIERVDFFFGAQTITNVNQGISIFDRGAAGAHDSVNIAVITGWTTIGPDRPTAYGGNVVTLDASDYGANLDTDPTTAGTQADLTYTLLRFNNGDNLTTLDSATETNTQGVAGSFISFADLGIAAGTTIFGYSIMGSDVTTNIANLADWNNAAFYPTNTVDANGGIDLMAFNGRIARPVPEPSTYGALLLGASVAAWWLRRRSLAARTAA